MKKIMLDKWDIKTLVLAMIVLSIVDRGRCLRRQCHVQTDKQTYLELACDTLGLVYSRDYFYMDVPTHGPINHIQDSPVVHDGAYHHLVDGQDESRATWTRYINSPYTKEGANMIVMQSKGHMMYRTLVHIPPCTELLVWYGEDYGKYLDDLREEREAYYDEEEEDIEHDSEDGGTENETEYDEEDDLSEVGDNGGDEEEEDDEIDSEDEGTEDDDEDNLSEVGNEETNSIDIDSNDIDKKNSNENKSENLFLNHIVEIVETKIYDQHKDTTINCSAKKTDDEVCMKPESYIYANENLKEDL